MVRLGRATWRPWLLPPRAPPARCARDADALLCFMTDRVDAALLEKCPRLRLVACALKGYDNFDLAACADRGVAVTAVPASWFALFQKFSEIKRTRWSIIGCIDASDREAGYISTLLFRDRRSPLSCEKKGCKQFLFSRKNKIMKNLLF